MSVADALEPRPRSRTAEETRRNRAFRIPFLVFGLSCFLAAIYGGLWRLGWALPHGETVGDLHGPLMIGGFFDAHHERWGAEEFDWFEALLNEQDVDIMAWAIGTAEAPERFRGSMLDQLKALDFIRIHR